MDAHIGMIAHDFTGAMDSIVAFVETPGDTLVLLQSKGIPDTAGNVAVVAPTQTLSPEVAYAGVRDAARLLKGRRLFKRVGSTLRGNIGIEIRAVIDETGTKALVCSALPREGRTVVDGMGLLDSVPLHLTEYGNDPAAPCRNASLPEIMKSSGIDAACVSLNVVRLGELALKEKLATTSSEAVIVDAETDQDMRIIATALAALGTGWCACASSGLSTHLALALGRRKQSEGCASLLPPTGGSLAIVGSRSTVAARQVARLKGVDSVAVIEVAAPELCSDSSEVVKWEREARGALTRGASAVLTTSLSPVVVSLRDEVAPRLGALAARVVQESNPVMVLSGGLTALSTCTALGIPSIEVLGEHEPGIVCSHGKGPDGFDRAFISKAGGFGDECSLARVLGVEQTN